MNVKGTLHLIGQMLFFLALILLSMGGVSALDNMRSYPAFMLSGGICILISVVLVILTKRPASLSPRDGFLIVTLSWIVFALIGGLPFYFDGTLPSLTDSFFEAMSGFTTTGSTVMTDISSNSMAILLWRSIIQWLGGMGIILLGIAILPEIGIGAMQLYRAEVPGPTKGRLYPRIQDTAKTLWIVYVILTLAEILLLKTAGISLYDAICHAFTTMATGGFSTQNGSVMDFANPAAEWIITVFMFLAGVNFTLHFYALIKGRISNYWRNSEFRTYVIIIGISICLITINLFKYYHGNFWETLRQASFQAVSIMTTTGYASADFELWPWMSQIILFILMFVGAMAGSTGGGMKIVRIQLMIKQGFIQLRKMIQPNLISQVKQDGKKISPEIIQVVSGFLLLYLSLFLISVIALGAAGIDFTTSLSAVAACLGNIGPGLGGVGAMDNYAHLPMMIKLLLSLLMLLGRLEIYTVLVLMIPHFWRD